MVAVLAAGALVALGRLATMGQRHQRVLRRAVDLLDLEPVERDVRRRHGAVPLAAGLPVVDGHRVLGALADRRVGALQLLLEARCDVHEGIHRLVGMGDVVCRLAITQDNHLQSS